MLVLSQTPLEVLAKDNGVVGEIMRIIPPGMRDLAQTKGLKALGVSSVRAEA